MKVEIWSDVVCPWCYIGKRRFEKALERFPRRDAVEILWRSFELDAGFPRDFEGTADERLAGKYGMSQAQAAAQHERVTSLAAQEGLEYRFDQALPGNTFDAHRLIHFAAARGLQGQMKERLLKAYFTDGEPIADRGALARLAGEIGLDAAEATQALETGAYEADVRADEELAIKFGIQGVPFFVIDGKYGISGAQSPDLFLKALEEAEAESRTAGGAT